jgi:hypothetical protein
MEQKGRVDGGAGRARAGHRGEGSGSRRTRAGGVRPRGARHGGGARLGTKRGKEVGRPSRSGVGASARVRAKRAGPGHVERERERRWPRLALLAGQKVATA